MEECKHELSSSYDIIGGIISPVHDEYGIISKPSLKAANSQHRLKMCQLATECSDWIDVSSFEIVQNNYTNTVDVLNCYHQQLNHIFMTNKDETKQIIKIILMCGSDLLLTFMEPNIWNIQDQHTILDKYGVVMMERKGYEITEDIYREYPLFNQYRHNIHSFQPSVENDISSTTIRKLIKDGQSIKYLTFDSVIEYIEMHKLYFD